MIKWMVEHPILCIIIFIGLQNFFDIDDVSEHKNVETTSSVQVEEVVSTLNNRANELARKVDKAAEEYSKVIDEKVAEIDKKLNEKSNEFTKAEKSDTINKSDGKYEPFRSNEDRYGSYNPY